MASLLAAQHAQHVLDGGVGRPQLHQAQIDLFGGGKIAALMKGDGLVEQGLQSCSGSIGA